MHPGPGPPLLHSPAADGQSDTFALQSLGGIQNDSRQHPQHYCEACCHRSSRDCRHCCKRYKIVRKPTVLLELPLNTYKAGEKWPGLRGRCGAYHVPWHSLSFLGPIRSTCSCTGPCHKPHLAHQLALFSRSTPPAPSIPGGWDTTTQASGHCCMPAPDRRCGTGACTN